MRRHVAIAAALLAAGVVWVGAHQSDRGARTNPAEAIRGRSEPPRNEEATSVAPAAVTAASPSVAGAAGAAAPKPLPRFAQPAAPPEPGADDPGPGPWIARYDGRSGRLSASLRPEGSDPTTRVASPGGAPTLVAWVPTIRVQAGGEVVIHAALFDEAGAPVSPDSITVSLARRGERPSDELPMRRAMPGSPHHFELRLQAPAADARTAGPAPAAFDYVVQARGRYLSEPYLRAAAAGFLVHSPGAGVDPTSARAERRGGDLQLLMDARIERAGTYWAWAELWGGPDGRTPIAFARDRFERLGPGVRRVALVFGGAIIHDAGVDGPYVVRNVRWQQVDAFPPQEQDPIAQLPPTAGFRSAEFY